MNEEGVKAELFIEALVQVKALISVSSLLMNAEDEEEEEEEEESALGLDMK